MNSLSSMEKWYVFNRTAEDNGYFTVALTENEHETVKKFLDAQDNGPDEGYSGYTYEIPAGPFDTQMEALKHLVKHSYPYSYDKTMTDDELTELAKQYFKEDK